MAYREFHYEKTYAKPNTAGFLDQAAANASQAVANIFSSIARGKQQREAKADEYKYTLAKGSSENDNIYFEEGAKAATNLMKDSIRSNDSNKQQQAQHLIQTLNEQHQERRLQDEQFKVANDSIEDREKKDPYYDGNVDREGLRVAYFGADHDRNFLTRGDDLDKASKVAGVNPRALKVDAYTADYVKNLGTVEKTVATGNPNSTKNRYTKTPFWDTTTGAPGVTDRHAVEYLKSRPDGSVQQYYETQINDELDKEVQQMKSTNDQRTEWMKGLSDMEIKNTLVNDPSKNIINKEAYGVRVRNKAKQKLTDAADINSKVSVEYKKDTSRTGGLYNNDSIAHSNTFYNEQVGTDAVSDKVADAFRMNQNAAPGGILMINKGTTTGKPIQFESGSKSIFNVNAGTTQQARGTATFNLTGYQVQAYDKNGKPYMIEAKDTDELKKAINNIPYSEFKNLEPTMNIALKGYSIDKGKLMGDVRSSTYDLNKKLAEAIDNNNVEQAAKIQNQLYEIDQFRQKLNADQDDFVDDDVLNAAAKNGITSVRTDQIIRADKADLDKINTITEGLNLSKQDKWSPQMRDVNELYKRRYQQAATAGFVNQATTKRSTKTTVVKKTITPQEFDSKWKTLKPGQTLVGPNGITYTKK